MPEGATRPEAMPAPIGSEQDALVQPLVGALKLGLDPSFVVLAWMGAHAASLAPTERVKTAMSVLVPHEQLNLDRSGLLDALTGLATHLAQPGRDGKAASIAVDDEGTAAVLAEWMAKLPRERGIRMFAHAGLAHGFGLGVSGRQTLVAMLRLTLKQPHGVDEAVTLLKNWQLGLQDHATGPETLPFLQAAIDEVRPAFSQGEDDRNDRKALLEALYSAYKK